MSTKKLPCAQCGAHLDFYWLKDGLCNACRNPHLVVTSSPAPQRFFYLPEQDENHSLLSDVVDQLLDDKELPVILQAFLEDSDESSIRELSFQLQNLAEKVYERLVRAQYEEKESLGGT